MIVISIIKPIWRILAPTTTTTTINGVIIDELLCFVQNKIDLLPPMSIGDLCTTTFNEQDIEASKRRLFELCADDSCTRMRKRTGPKRSALNIDDIIRLLHEKGTDTPTFVARDLGKLPPVTFDSIDVSALLRLLHSIRQNEAAINVLKDCVTTQQASAKTIVGVVNNVVSRISAVELRQPSVRNAATRPVVPAAIAVPASTSAVPVSASPAAANDDEDDTSSDTATTNALSDTPSLDPEREDWPDLGEQPSWSTVAGRRNTKAKAQQPKRQQQPRQQQQQRQPQQRAQTTTNTIKAIQKGNHRPSERIRYQVSQCQTLCEYLRYSFRAARHGDRCYELPKSAPWRWYDVDCGGHSRPHQV